MVADSIARSTSSGTRAAVRSAVVSRRNASTMADFPYLDSNANNLGRCLSCSMDGIERILDTYRWSMFKDQCSMLNVAAPVRGTGFIEH